MHAVLKPEVILRSFVCIRLRPYRKKNVSFFIFFFLSVGQLKQAFGHRTISFDYTV